MGKKGARSNAAADSYSAEMAEALSGIGDVSRRSMFGGFGLFESGAMFAIVDSSACLYFKASESTKPRYEQADSKQHRPMPYFEVPADVLDSSQMLEEWANEAVQVAHESQKGKKKGK